MVTWSSVARVLTRGCGQRGRTAAPRGAAVFLTVLWAVTGFSAPVMAARGLFSAAQPAGVSQPARELARRLGIASQAFVGNQMAGRGGPWTAWFPRSVAEGWVAPGGVPTQYLPLAGPALFAGPGGADGQFHYFNPGPVLRSGGSDPYRGSALTRARAMRVVVRWLHRAGAPIPRVSLRVRLGSGATSIGGTGLCCYRSLAAISWGTTSSAAGVIYVADRGTVVQADIGPPPASSGGLSRPCAGQVRADANGVALGDWCFSYPEAVRAMIVSDIGNHSPWLHDPAQVAAGVFASALPAKGDTRPVVRQRKRLLSRERAVFIDTYRNVTYRLTLVPAFPRLVGSIWEVVGVKHAP